MTINLKTPPGLYCYIYCIARFLPFLLCNKVFFQSVYNYLLYPGVYNRTGYESNPNTCGPIRSALFKLLQYSQMNIANNLLVVAIYHSEQAFGDSGEEHFFFNRYKAHPSHTPLLAKERNCNKTQNHQVGITLREKREKKKGIAVIVWLWKDAELSTEMLGQV